MNNKIALDTLAWSFVMKDGLGVWSGVDTKGSCKNPMV